MSIARKVILNARPFYDQGTHIEVHAHCWFFSMFHQTPGSIAWGRVLRIGWWPAGYKHLLSHWLRTNELRRSQWDVITRPDWDGLSVEALWLPRRQAYYDEKQLTAEPLNAAFSLHSYNQPSCVIGRWDPLPVMELKHLVALSTR